LQPPEPPTAEVSDIYDRKPIHVAAENGNIEAVKQHLADGADVNAKDAFGRTLLDLVTQLGQTEIADLLCKPGGISEPTRP
jgi:ankyrin repeat protein